MRVLTDHGQLHGPGQELVKVLASQLAPLLKPHLLMQMENGMPVLRSKQGACTRRPNHSQLHQLY